jgi:hypothetical protein
VNDTLLFRSATDTAQALRRKELSSRELTEMLLLRIEAANPALNAVVELRREAALQEALSADEATARGEDAGALHGVPITIKDSFNVAGVHTTWGNPAFKDFVADWDATVAWRLRRAGAIIIGKTNVAFMLGDFGQTANELYGVRRDDVPRIHIGPRRLHPHPGELLRRLRTQTQRRDRPVERVPAAGSPASSERHDVHVRGRPARPIPTRPADGVERHRRPREPSG